MHLEGDDDLSHGFGLVLDKREDTAEMLREFIAELGSPGDDHMREAMDIANSYLLNNSVYLVHWQGGKIKDNVYRNIWMFSAEIRLLSRARNDLGEI